MSSRQPIASIGLFLIVALFSVLTRDIAGAQERWPPWQSYGEAESAARKKAARRRPATADVAALNKQIAQLKAAGKYAEAVPLAKQALALAEKKGPSSPDVAQALDTLAGLYEAQNKYAEAEPLLKRSLAIRVKAPGQPFVAASRERRAVAYVKLGRSADAQATRGSDLLAQKSGGGGAAKNGAGQADAEHKAAEARVQEERRAEAAKADAERAQQESAQAQAGKKSAQAEEKKDEPALTPLPRFSARRMARPPEAAEPAPIEIPAADGAGAPSSSATDEMKPGAPAPAEDNAPLGNAGPLPEGAFGGAPPPVAEAPEPPTAPAPPPPMAEASPAAPVPPPPLDGLDGVGRGRSMAEPPAVEAAPPSASPAAASAPPPPAAAPASPPPAKMTAAPSGGGAVAPAPETDWQTVPVYWGTDRAVQPNAKRLVFGSDRARKLQLGEALVTVPKVHEVPNVERPWVVKIPYFDVTLYAESEDPKRHFTVKEIKALTKEELLAQVKARLGASKLFKDQAIVFVHGYNTSFDNALYRTAQIAYDIDFDGAAFLYSWPSGGAVASYTYDRESAQASEPYLREFLEMVVKQTGAKSVNIIAHSMGNQPLMDVLRDMRNSAPEGVAIGQVFLAAPDVDADSFSNLAKAIQGLAKNVTLYVASNDRALIVSRNFWGSYRAGDVPPAGPLILPGIDTIDVTAASTDTFAINHSGYASNNKLLEDIGELLKTGLRPPEMRILKPGKITTQAGDFWRYAPAP
ncbi:MAG: alpha/beta hydrolase [Hyphomicrobium sp.]|nr:alpha/beta hydrolase [Hyphomicrobium sp.]